MPGANPAEAWGALPLVVDTSAFVRGRTPAVRDAWLEALAGDRLRLSPIVRMEILYTARGGAEYDLLAEELDAIRPAPLTSGSLRAAQSAMRGLAHRHAGAQRVPIVDYLVAAAAEHLGAAVLHYERDYDRLAEVLSFESAWLAPPGTLA